MSKTTKKNNKYVQILNKIFEQIFKISDRVERNGRLRLSYKL